MHKYNNSLSRKLNSLAENGGANMIYVEILDEHKVQTKKGFRLLVKKILYQGAAHLMCKALFEAANLVFANPLLQEYQTVLTL